MVTVARMLTKYLESVSDKHSADVEMIFSEILVYDVNAEGRMENKQTARINSPAPNA